MSSAISTKAKADEARDAAPEPGLQAWQFFVLAGLGCATAATFMARGQGVTAVVLVSLLMGTAAVVGMAMLRTLRPLVSPDEDRTAMIGQRTRAALEREKLLSLRAIKELEFDRAMGKLSEEDFREMSGRLRTRAARIIRQLDAGAGYRDQIERDLAARLKPSRSGDHPSRSGDHHDVRPTPGHRSAPAPSRVEGEDSAERPADSWSAKASADRNCDGCHTANDHDARFCKNCGRALG